MHVSTHNMAYWKETAMHVWSHHSADLSSHAALIQKRNISDSRAVIWCVDLSYTSYNFELCIRERKNKSKLCMLDFLDCEKD